MLYLVNIVNIFLFKHLHVIIDIVSMLLLAFSSKHYVQPHRAVFLLNE